MGGVHNLRAENVLCLQGIAVGVHPQWSVIGGLLLGGSVIGGSTVFSKLLFLSCARGVYISHLAISSKLSSKQNELGHSIRSL